METTTFIEETNNSSLSEHTFDTPPPLSCPSDDVKRYDVFYEMILKQDSAGRKASLLKAMERECNTLIAGSPKFRNGSTTTPTTPQRKTRLVSPPDDHRQDKSKQISSRPNTLSDVMTSEQKQTEGKGKESRGDKSYMESRNPSPSMADLHDLDINSRRKSNGSSFNDSDDDSSLKGIEIIDDGEKTSSFNPTLTSPKKHNPRPTRQYAGEEKKKERKRFVVPHFISILPGKENNDSTNMSSKKTTSASAHHSRHRNRKKSTGGETDPPKTDRKFRIIVLLMSPAKRTFEFVYLYFDYNAAVVTRDLIDLIPSNAMDKKLGKQKYVGLCRTGTGQELITSCSPKSQNIRFNEIFIAIPKRFDGKTCAELAEQIFKDQKLIHLVKQHDPRSSPARKKKQGSCTTMLMWKKLQDGPMLLSRKTRSKVSNGFSRTKNVVHERRKLRVATKKTKQVVEVRHYLSLSLIVCFVVVTMKLITFHLRITEPLKPGDTIRAGEWRSKCGLFGIFPERITGCHPIALEMRSDSVLALYDGGIGLEGPRSVLWEMKNAKRHYHHNRDDDKGLNNEQTNRISEARIEGDGSVIIQGGEATVVFINDDYVAERFDQWPFSVTPPAFTKFPTAKRNKKHCLDFLEMIKVSVERNKKECYELFLESVKNA